MPGSYLNYPFDEELFLMQWMAAQDPVKLAMFNSGAFREDATIRRLIANGSNYFTMPIYNVLGGEPDNYDGVTDITMDEPDGKYQAGVVYGRAHSWKDRDFIHDFNSGADPMQQITSQVAKYWNKKRQKTVLSILNGLFDITDDTYGYKAKWAEHSYDISATGAATDANKMGPTTMGDAIQKALGDNGDIISMAWMHSRVAQNLANLQLLEFRKYTDSSGIERQLKIADYNGITVIVDDDAPTSGTGDSTKYTTYVLGTGSILHAPAPVEHPVEIGRNELSAGGYNFYVTRFRECYHPNGFSYVLPDKCISPTDAQLSAPENWIISTDPKIIPIARIISNG